MELSALYRYTEAQGYRVTYLPLETSPAACTPTGLIALNPDRLPAEQAEKEALAHEAGHLETGSFYTVSDSPSTRARLEERARRWSYRCLVPLSRLLAAMREGHCTPWELAEYFDVSEPFLLAAVAYYKISHPAEIVADDPAVIDCIAGYDPTPVSPATVDLAQRASELRQQAHLPPIESTPSPAEQRLAQVCHQPPAAAAGVFFHRPLTRVPPQPLPTEDRKQLFATAPSEAPPPATKPVPTRRVEVWRYVQRGFTLSLERQWIEEPVIEPVSPSRPIACPKSHDSSLDIWR